MQQFKSKLTRLRGLIEKKLPDEPDIFGYLGVTKVSILAAVDNVYNLSQEIRLDDESRFEVISLKRAGSDLYDELKEFLEADLSEEVKRARFDQFLNSLSALTEKIKITYFIVVKNGIRDDEELARIKNNITTYEGFSGALELQKQMFDDHAKSIIESISEIKSNHKATKPLAAELVQWHTSTNEQYPRIKAIHDAVTGWDEEVGKATVKYKEMADLFEALAKDQSRYKDEMKEHSNEGGLQVEFLQDTAEKHTKLLEEIRQTLEGANRVGMASSFNTRKEELKTHETTWQTIFVATILMICGAVWKFVLPTITASSTQWSELIAELGIVSPLIWLGWFAAKQYGYTSRIREDYAFKAASAMAYEGHKKAARETNKDLEEKLLELSLVNMSQNPIRLYRDTDVHASPVHELTSQVFGNQSVAKQLKAKLPTGGEVEASVGAVAKEPEQVSKA